MPTFKKISFFVAMIILAGFYSCQQNATQVATDSDKITDIPITTSNDDARAEFMKGLSYVDLNNDQNNVRYLFDHGRRIRRIQSG